MKEKEKKDQLPQTLKAGKLDSEQQEEEGEVALKVLDMPICGCDFGDPCCPDK
jgi:hypothetical protein